MKKLSAAEKERLHLLIEECAEIQQAATKVLRFGYDNPVPHEPNKTNKDHLHQELGDLMVILDMMQFSLDIHEFEIRACKERKRRKVSKHLKHQGDNNG